MRAGLWSRARAATLTAVVWSVCAVQPAGAVAGNPHNLGSCSSCHPSTPRFGIDTRRSVTFTTSADDPGLCAPCHAAGKHSHPVLVDAGSGPSGARTSVYLPAGSSAAFAGKIVCTSCHFIHAADIRYALLRGFPGTSDPHYFPSFATFCEECHGTNLASRPAHGGGERSCVFCHAGKPGQTPMGELASSLRERCGACHRGVKDDHFDKLNPFGRRRECNLCHDRHAVSPESPGLLSEGYLTAAAGSVFISPHFRRGLCLACHANTDDYTLRDENVNALCDRCHASGQIRSNIHPLRKVSPKINVPKGWPLTDGALTCLTCHVQGHKDQPQRPGMLPGGGGESPRAACLICHGKTGLKTSKIHREISEGASCGLCHKTRPQPGTDTIKTVTFLAEPDLLCLRCHDQDVADGSLHHDGVIGREVEEDHLSTQLPLFQGSVICATCHDPHLGGAAGFRLRRYIEDSNFCLVCHKE